MVNEVKLKLAIDGAAQVSSQLDGVEQKIGGLGQAIGKLAHYGAALYALPTALNATVGALVRSTDAITTLNTQLRLATGSTAQATQAYGALFDMAQRARVSFIELGTTFAAIARSGKELGISQERLLAVTQSISQAMTIGGGSAASMQAALVQLGQGLASGTLRGEELNSIMEQTPRLAQAIADGLGVPIGRLREMGAAGELTAQQVIAALEKAGPQLAKEMASATLTVGQAMTMLANSAAKLAGQADTASAASGKLSGVLQGLSGMLDAVAGTIKNHETAFAIIANALAGAATVGGITALALAISTRLTPAVVGLGVAMAANPVILALAGIAAAGAAIITLASSYNASADAMKGKITAIGDEIAKIESAQAMSRGSAEFQARIAARKEELVLQRAELVQTLAAAQADQGAQVASANSRAAHSQLMKDRLKDQADFAKAGEAFLSKEEKNQATLNAEIDRARALFEKGSISAAQYAQRINAVQASFAKLGAKDGANKALREQEDLLKSVTHQAQTLADARNKEYAEIEKYTAAQNLSAIESGNAADAAVRAAQLELDQRGMLNSAIADTTAARLQDQLINFTAGEKDYDSLVRQINAQKQLAAIYRQGETIDAVNKLKNANQQAAKESEKYWEDALMRAFESGKGFFQSLWDTIKNTLKTQVLKVTVQGVMGTLGGVMGTLGLGAAGAAAAGQGGDSSSILSTLGGLKSLSDIGKSISNGIDSYSIGSGFNAVATSTFGQSMAWSAASPMNNPTAYGGTSLTSSGQSISDGLTTAGQILGYAAAFKNFTDGKYGQSIGTAIGTYIMPGVGTFIGSTIGGMVDSMFGGGGGPKVDSSYGLLASIGDQSKTGIAGSFVNEATKYWDGLASIYKTLPKLDIGTLISADPQGDSLTILNVSGSVNGKSVYDRGARLGGTENVGRSEAELSAALTEEMSRVIIAGLKSSELPKTISDILDSADIGSFTKEKIADLIKIITDLGLAVNGFNAVAKKLPFENLKNLSFDAAAGLIAAAGGLESLSANLGSYYDNFYSEEEKRLQVIKNINVASAGSGLDAATATRESFRKIVEAQDLTTDSGRKTYASLLGVSGAMGGLIVESENLAKAASEAAAALKKAAIEAQQSAVTALFSAGANLVRYGTGLTDQIAPLQDAARQEMVTAEQAFVTEYNAIVARKSAAESAYASAASAAINAQNAYNSAVTSAANAIKGAKASVQSALDGITNAYLSAKNRVASLQKQSIDALRTVADNLTQMLDDLAGKSQATAQGYAYQKASFTDLAAKARVGDSVAAQALPAAAQSLLDASKLQATTLAQYKADETSVRQMLAGVQQSIGASAGPASANTDLADAIAELARMTIAVQASGASMVATLDDPLKAYNDAITNLAQVQSDSQASVAAAYATLQSANAEAATTAKTLADAVAEYAAATQLANDLGIEVATKGANSLQALGDAFTKAKSAATEMGGLADVSKTALEKYHALMAEIEDFTARTRDLNLGNFNSQVSALGGLLGAYAAAVAAMQAAGAGNGTTAYFAANPDVAAAFAKDPLGLTADQFAQTHSDKFGIKEQRITPDDLATLGSTIASTASAATVTAVTTGVTAASAELAAVNARRLAIDPSASVLTSMPSFAKTAMDLANSYFNVYADVAKSWADNVDTTGRAWNMTKDQFAQYHYATFGTAEGRKSPTELNLAGFARGANWIPQDMVAQIHKGEAIIPAAFNPERYNRASGNDALVAEIKALREEVKQLRADNSAENHAIVNNTKDTSKALTRAMPDGDALAVRTAA